MKNVFCVTLFILLLSCAAWAEEPVSKQFSSIYDPGTLKPVDSELRVKVGEVAPDFALTSVTGDKVRLSSYRGKANVVLSFIPAAWTPVCSGQWPGYNIAKPEFEKYDAVLLGISVDNIPTLYTWIEQMGGLWFLVLSDFFPHGEVAEKYGVLRSDGTAERALIFINKQGLITSLHVGDINVRPPLELLFKELKNFSE